MRVVKSSQKKVRQNNLYAVRSLRLIHIRSSTHFGVDEKRRCFLTPSCASLARGYQCKPPLGTGKSSSPFVVKHSVGMYRSVEKNRFIKPCIPYGMHPMVLVQVAYLRHARIGREHLFLPSDIPYGKKNNTTKAGANH